MIKFIATRKTDTEAQGRHRASSTVNGLIKLNLDKLNLKNIKQNILNLIQIRA